MPTGAPQYFLGHKHTCDNRVHCLRNFRSGTLGFYIAATTPEPRNLKPRHRKLFLSATAGAFDNIREHCAVFCCKRRAGILPVSDKSAIRMKKVNVVIVLNLLFPRYDRRDRMNVPFNIVTDETNRFGGRAILFCQSCSFITLEKKKNVKVRNRIIS